MSFNLSVVQRLFDGKFDSGRILYKDIIAGFTRYIIFVL